MRAPTTPAMTAQTATELNCSEVPVPAFSNRRPVSHTDAITPSAIIKP
jgi:hypothetical protein